MLYVDKLKSFYISICGWNFSDYELWRVCEEKWNEVKISTLE